MSPSILAAVPPPPPPGTNYLAVIKPTLTGVLISHSFTVLLIPLLIALLYFSTPRSRRKPIFILNIITIALAFTVGVLLDYRGLRTIQSPLNPPPLSINLVVGVFGAVQSILVDTILLLRLLAVYPKSYIGKKKFIQLIALPIVLKVARIINLFIFIKVLVDATKDPVTASAKIAQVWLQAPYLKIEWFMQLFDNTYASAFFLLRLVLRQREKSRNQSDSPFGTATSSSVSFTERLKILFWIAVTNFVFPVLFSLAQLIIVYREVNFVIVNDIVLANTMIAVIGVVFATVWAGSSHWRQENDGDRGQSDVSGGQAQVISAMVFGRNELSSGVVTVHEALTPDSEKPMTASQVDVEKHLV